MKHIRCAVFLFVLALWMMLSSTQAQVVDSLSAIQKMNAYCDSLIAHGADSAVVKWRFPFYGAKEPFKKTILREIPFGNEPRSVRLQNKWAAIYPNIRIHPNDGMTQTEMSIATHPTNPDIVLAGSNAVDPTLAIRTKGWYYSTNGGVSWAGSDTLPTQDVSTYTSDPVVAIDWDGNLFLNGVRYSPLSAIFVAKSENDGSSWNQVNVVDKNTGDAYDKNYLTIDINENSSYKNYVFTAFHFWTQNSCAYPAPTIFSRSTDRGVSFSAPITISGSIGNHTIGVNVAVGPNGEVYSTWTGYADWCAQSGVLLGFNRSFDGGASWESAKKIRDVNGIATLNKGGNSIFAHSFPSMAVDRSNSPRRGWIYVVYPEKAPTTPDIFLICSTDSGASWSKPKKVNQDSSNNDQFHPWISVDPATGALYVVYYDSRNFTGNDSAQVYISASFDGGETFGDVLMSDVPFLPKAIVPGVQYMGDYIGISALEGVVWSCWNDDRTGIHQAYASRMVFPPTSVTVLPSTIPNAFALHQNYPNPFNPSTKIRFVVPVFGFVSLKVYDLLGREVATLVKEEKRAGSYEVQWNAIGFSSGIYFYKLQSGNFVEIKRMVMIK